MRLIAGINGGRQLKTVNEPGLRPAMGKTREALFSMLEARGVEWPCVKVLDLFAGCGSIGLECLSRGAELAWFVEKERRVYECLSANANALGYQNRVRLWKMDALLFLRSVQPEAFNLIFLDPPYRRNYFTSSLSLLAKRGWLKNGGLAVAEIETDLVYALPDAFSVAASRDFGQTRLLILSHENKDDQ